MFANLSANVRAAIFTASVTLLLAALGAAYTIGYGNGAKDLESVNDFRKVDLPRTIADLQILSKELRDRAELANANEQLKKRIAGFEEEARNLKNEYARLAPTLSEREKTISEREKTITELKITIARAFPKEVISQVDS